MTLLTQKLSKLFFAETSRVITLALFVVVFGDSATFAQTNQQVSFTATATGSITGVTKLPGGLTQHGVRRPPGARSAAQARAVGRRAHRTCQRGRGNCHRSCL